MGAWDTRPNPDEAVADHETNPEYEVHVGQVDAYGARLCSVWLQGQRWIGPLFPG